MTSPIKRTIPQQIADHLKQSLLERKWEEYIPGRQILSKELGQSPRNIQKALAILENEGFLIPQGKGKRSKISLPKESVNLPFKL